MTPSTVIDPDTIPAPYLVPRRKVRMQIALRGSTAQSNQSLRASGISVLLEDGRQVAGPPSPTIARQESIAR